MASKKLYRRIARRREKGSAVTIGPMLGKVTQRSWATGGYFPADDKPTIEEELAQEPSFGEFA